MVSKFLILMMVSAPLMGLKDDPGQSIEMISYSAAPAPFCGRCESLDLTVSADGNLLIELGYWAGRYRDWRVRRARKRITAEQFKAFREILAPFRPIGARELREGSPFCETVLTDQGESSVRWVGGGPDASLKYDWGCDPERWRSLRDALRKAPKIVGVAKEVN
ncbi:MAG: hypothetical protein ACXWVH_05250 [Caulobacteraceae bacterium]